MSSALQAQTGQPVGSSSNNTTSAKYNSWIENSKIKTCKCTVCDSRVRNTSQKCNGCGRHVCSDCLDPSSDKDQYYKEAAKDRIEQGCWACNWRSNMNPAFARRKPAPEVRIEEERKARASKALGTSRRAFSHTFRQHPSIVTASSTESGTSNTPRNSGPTTPAFTRSSGAQSPSATLTASNGADVIVAKRKRELDEDYDPAADLSEFQEPMVIAKKAKRSMFDQISTTTVDQIPVPSKPPADSNKASDTTETDPVAAATMQAADPDTLARFEAGSTVIVGAGIVGLFIAYELASKLREAGIDHDVAIVDIRSSYSELASGACHGILTDVEVSDGCMPLAEVAQAYWQRLVADADFHRDVYMGNRSVFRVMEDDGTHREQAPSWFHGSAGCSFEDMSDKAIRVDSKALASWLYKQCMAMKVSTAFGSVVSGCKVGKSATLTDVYIEKQDRSKGRLRCQNLILAAGAFTTGILNDLFEYATELRNVTCEVQRLHVELGAISSEDNVALILPNAANPVDALRNIMMSACPGDKRLNVSAMDRDTTLAHIGGGLALAPRRAKTTELRQIASRYFDHANMDITDRKTHHRAHRSYLSYACGRGPIIDEATPNVLGLNSSDVAASEHSGVWLCYGFGHHGTTLAPGAAEVLVSKLFAAVERRDGRFSVQECGVPFVEGKGSAGGTAEFLQE